MKGYIVITGDVIGFTSITVSKRKKLMLDTNELMASWVQKPGYARVFRGDSFQMLFENTEEALKRSIQLRCWFKKNSSGLKDMLDVKMAIGIGNISYHGKTVLDSDGEAFHLSGRTFDVMEEDENLSIVTSDKLKNEQLKIILNLADIIISSWTINQATVIYLLLEGKTQQQMADELKISQSAVNNRIKLSRWKKIEKAIRYIATLIDQQ